jgi:hypothetical protein
VGNEWAISVNVPGIQNKNCIEINANQNMYFGGYLSRK